MKEYTTFKIGGIAKILVMPENIESFTGLFKIIKENQIKYILLGNGSNVLISENDFDGVCIVTSKMNKIAINDDRIIYADCGANLTRISSVAKDNGLTGLEFAYGIPGTVGGAVYMNAGAYGGQMSDIVYRTQYLDISSHDLYDLHEIKSINIDKHEFAYRKSLFIQNKNYIILSTELKLKQGEKSEIEKIMAKNMTARKEKQPLEYPSAGSVFKRGNGYITAELIEKCGLKGCIIGNAQVSEKHAGFIINKGNAKYTDVINLIEHIQSTIYAKTGINIECEIRIIDLNSQ